MAYDKSLTAGSIFQNEKISHLHENSKHPFPFSKKEGFNV
jgi:hypothetical protein